MSTELPVGHSWRPAALTDAEAILELVGAHNTKLIGIPDCVLDDVNDQLVEPGLVLDTDTWLVHAPGGSLVGFGWVYAKATGEQADLDIVASTDEVAGWLVGRGLARATELAQAGGHERAEVHLGFYRQDTGMRDVAAAHGFSGATTFQRMRIDHDGTRHELVAPAGVTLRSGPGDEAFRRTAHQVLDESFKDHFGHVSRPFEQWHEAREREAAFDWRMITLAYLDAKPVGILLTLDRFVEDENCGYVGDIGVLAEARGRGIAKYLLRTAFEADIAAGRAGTILHVDANNTTPALGLYEGVGMRLVLAIDVWRYVITS
jgi:ribosomal protein S18 acetylase RimI-like enzyme